MAKKNSRHYPVVRSFPLTAGAAANTVCDVAKNLSRANRRLMRMGRYYEVKVDIRPDYAGPAIEVWALRDDWAVQKGFQMAYQAYLDAMMEEREKLSDTQLARWEDFRVYHGLTGSVQEANVALGTASGTYGNLASGEFDLSQIVIGDDTTRTFTWGVPGASQFGILQEYDKAGNQQTTPDSVVAGGPYTGLTTSEDDQASQDLQNHGNNPPYNASSVDAQLPWVRVAVLGSGAAGQQRLSSGFFTAPCGLVFLKGFTETSEAYSVSIEAKSGDYKGVHAPSMIEVATVNRKRKVVK